MVGDFNVHFDVPCKWDVRRFCTILDSSGLKQHIIGPTHICGHTLDLVITRHDDSLIKRYTIDRNDFRIDHFMINCVLDLPKPSAAKITFTTRKYQLIDHEAFSGDIAAKMHNIECRTYENVNNLLADYNTACSEVLDKHAPPTTMTRSVIRRPAWYNETVKDARRVRRRCERKWRKSNTNANYKTYQESKQNVTDHIHNAKKSYFESKFNDCSVKDMYKTVNELMYTSNKTIPDTDSPMDLANDFGQFFVGKVNKIREEVDSIKGSDSSNTTESLSYLRSTPVTCLFSDFQSVTNEELLKIIRKCPNKSCVMDPMPTYLVKEHVDVLLPTLCRIVNTSLQSGLFPDDLHKAIVTPVLKKASLDRNQLKNYRPVSNLHFTSKVIEKCASKQIIEHTEAHGLSEPLQSAYRGQHSTETALACVHNNIMRA